MRTSTQATLDRLSEATHTRLAGVPRATTHQLEFAGARPPKESARPKDRKFNRSMLRLTDAVFSFNNHRAGPLGSGKALNLRGTK
jgi:hypothetical protein